MTPSLTAQILLAQAVNQVGSQSWDELSKTMQGARILPEDGRRVWSSSECERVYKELLAEHKMQLGETVEPKSATTSRMVEILYTARLRQIIHALEENAKRAVQIKEFIDQVEAGKRDEMLRNATPEIRKQLELNERAAATKEEPDVEKEQDEAAGSSSPMKESTPKTRRRAQEAQEAEVKASEDVVAESSPAGTPAPSVAGSDTSRVHGTRSARKRARDDSTANTPEPSASDVKDEAAEAEHEAESEQDEGEDEDEEDDEEEEQVTTRSRKRGRSSVQPSGAASPAASKAGTTGSRKKRKKSETPAAEPSPPPAVRTRRSGRAASPSVDVADDAASDGKRSKTSFTKQRAKNLIEELSNEQVGDIFREPVPKREERYRKAVLSPIALSDLKNKVNKGSITNWAELSRDFYLMCANAVQFNGLDSEPAEMARELAQIYERRLQELMASEYEGAA